MLNKLIQKYFRHFSFFYSFLGYRLFFLLFLSLLVGLLDGFGLALFIPIFQIAADSSDLTSTNPETMGELQFLLNWIQNLGFELIPFPIESHHEVY